MLTATTRASLIDFTPQNDLILYSLRLVSFCSLSKTNSYKNCKCGLVAKTIWNKTRERYVCRFFRNSFTFLWFFVLKIVNITLP